MRLPDPGCQEGAAMTDVADIGRRIAGVRPALDALRFFTASTRGFRDREQERLAMFLEEVAGADLAEYTRAELKEWLQTKAGWINTRDYRAGDTSGYLAMLQAIPPHLLARTRDYAYAIAGGSGRRPIADDMRARIEQEFSPAPTVAPPPPEDDDGLPGIRFGVD